MASVMLNTKLNRYFADSVQMSRNETSRIVAEVMPDIEDIVKCISDLDPRFGCEVRRIGSYYQGLKVKQADEFDLSIPLQYLAPLQWATSAPCMFGFNDPSYNYSCTMNQELKIVPANTALQRPGKQHNPLSISGPAASKYNELMFDTFLIPFLVKLKMKAMLFQALSQLQLRGWLYFENLKNCLYQYIHI